MKLFVQTSLLSIGLLFLAYSFARAQKTDFPTLSKGKYVVIGAFNLQKNATGFLKYVKAKPEYEVSGGYHPKTKYYYIYLRTLNPGEDAVALVNRYRKTTEFIDTWVMNVNEVFSGGTASPTLALDDSKKSEIKDNPNAGTSADDEANESVNRLDDTGPMVKGQSSDSIDRSSGIARLTAKEKVIPTTYLDKTGKYKLYFNTFYVRTSKEVKGNVDIIDPKRLKKLKSAYSYELVMVPDPNNGSHEVQLIANIFGYKKVQHDIRLDEPFNDVNQEFFYFTGDTLMVDFPLIRYETGDVATMYRVFFYKDAAIMKPESKYEVNSLLDMLKENKNYRIKIHGHTNGNSPGKIIELAEVPDNFYSLNSAGKEGFGSAKELSRQRAEVIKKYLVSFGINPSRMEIIGWGGKKPIYDKFDRLAVKNVRVEIEILQH